MYFNQNIRLKSLIKPVRKELYRSYVMCAQINTDKIYTITREGGKKKMEGDKEDNGWVFESLVGFLTGPVWNIPIMNFIENKSSVFDPNEDNQEEYMKIHEEFKNLVDLMLNSFTQDLGITGEQFEKACVQTTGDMVTSQLQKTLFDQIWAAEDYSVFVRMMIQKNTELQLQALEFLKGRGISFDTSDDSVGADEYNDNDILKEALRQSFEEHKKNASQSNKEEEDLKKVLAATIDEEKRRLQLEKQADQQLLQKAIQLSLEQGGATGGERGAGAGDRPASLSPSSDDVVTMPIEEPKKTNMTDTGNKPEISQEEIAKRQSYLRQQRDKLVALKMKKRLQHLDEIGKVEGADSRPRSAKVARDALQNKTSGHEESDVNPKMLAARHALVARLKAEVLAKKD